MQPNVDSEEMMTEMSIGYDSLKAAVEKDCKGGNDCFSPIGCKNPHPWSGGKGCFHKYCDTFVWAIARAKHYAEKMGLPWEDILDAWERDRKYWYLSYYQDCNQPVIEGDHVRVFDTVEQLKESVGEPKFRCPMCRGVSTSPSRCNTGLEMQKGKICDWAAFGLFGTLGKGVTVYCKVKLQSQHIFMPVAWEEAEGVRP